MASARTVHVTGAATEKGETTRIDLRLKRGAGAVGSIGVAKGSLNLIRLGKVAYVEGGLPTSTPRPPASRRPRSSPVSGSR